MSDPPRIIAQTILEHSLLKGVRRLGLAVSGGADSIALLHLLLPICRQNQIKPILLHFNHGLRGAESATDRDTVVAAAEALGLECHTAEGQVESGQGLSLEMAARHARLHFYFAMTATHRLDAIATGHHANDVAETLLLRLLRGSGTRGLTGLRHSSRLRQGDEEITLIRPLLDCPSDTLRAWLTHNHLTWREDASNTDPSIPRNAIRLNLLPALANYCDDPLRQITRTAAILRTEDQYLEELANQWLEIHRHSATQSTHIPISLLKQQPLALRRRILRGWLLSATNHPAAAGFDSIATILHNLRSKRAWQHTLPGTNHISATGDKLTLALAYDLPAPTIVPINSHIVWTRHLSISTRLAAGIHRDRTAIGHYPIHGSLSYEALKDKPPLTVRSRQPGDRIAPLGLKGSRKVQDILVDAKIPRHQRDLIPIFVCGDELVWIPGYRVSRHFAVRNEDETALQISLTPR